MTKKKAKPKTKSKPAKPAPHKRAAAAKPDAFEWVERRVKLTELKPYERNPRRISEQDFANLKASLQQDGYHQRILATHDLRVVGGHQRIRALRAIGKKEITVLVPPRAISDEDFQRILIRDNLPFGEFDMDMLGADFERDQLVEYGMPEKWLPGAPIFEQEGGENQSDLDTTQTKEQVEVTCPECSHEFSVPRQ